MPPPDDESRAQILALELGKMPLNFILPSYEDHIANNKNIDNKNKNKTKDASRNGSKDRNSNENDDKKNIFDWHSSNPIVSTTDLNSKLNNFSFSDDYNVEKITQSIAAHNDKGKDEDDENQNKKEVEVEGEVVVEVGECSVDEKNLLSELLRRTKGFSGAEMVAAVQEAGMLAIDSGADALELSHLFDAIHGIIPQITQDILDFYEKIAADY